MQTDGDNNDVILDVTGMEQSKDLLPSLWSKGLVLIGIIIACSNMIAVWAMLSSMIPSTVGGQNSKDVLTRMINNNMSVTILAISFSFVLLSIGFSLFVMGYQSALNVKGSVKDFGSLAIKSTSPGVLCIIAATIVIISSLFSKVGYTVKSDNNVTGDAPPTLAPYPDTEDVPVPVSPGT